MATATAGPLVGMTTERALVTRFVDDHDRARMCDNCWTVGHHRFVGGRLLCDFCASKAGGKK